MGFTVSDVERLIRIQAYLYAAINEVVDVHPSVDLRSQELDNVKSHLQSLIISLQLRGMGEVKQADFHLNKMEHHNKKGTQQ